MDGAGPQTYGGQDEDVAGGLVICATWVCRSEHYSVFEELAASCSH